MYEHRHQPLLPRRAFAMRFLRHVGYATPVLGASLVLGMVGYHGFERLDWVAAFLNSAMLLGGMGPVDAPHTTSGKLFAGVYALYAGLVFILVTGILLAPLLHRILHWLHVESKAV
ncbi:MAG TPA: hypothetical protein VKH19_14585 [Gemmatimonadaceae bacterium]|nr:hypothetical protein [Gemmatimonadaceae bacterium]